MIKRLAAMMLSMILTVGVLVSAGETAQAAAPVTKTFGYSDPTSQRTYVPIRFLSEFAGATVNWQAAKNQIDITRENQQITLYMNQKKAVLNGQTETLDAVPFSDRGVTYVPLRFVSKALGLNLKWDSSTVSVHVTNGKQQIDLPVIRRGSLDGNPITSEQRSFSVNGRSFSARVIKVKMLHPRVTLDAAFAYNQPGKVQALSGIAADHGAYAAINGTFFDAYTNGSYKAPYGYVISRGDIKFRNEGTDRTIFTFDENQLSRLIPGLQFQKYYEQGAIEGGIQAGPLLLRNGQYAVNAAKEGFRDPKILTGGGARSALGITANHELILLTVNSATIPQLAGIMKQAGAYQAMNLDGGASSGLYYNGRYLTTPGRAVSNALLIKLK